MNLQIVHNNILLRLSKKINKNLFISIHFVPFLHILCMFVLNITIIIHLSFCLSSPKYYLLFRFLFCNHIQDFLGKGNDHTTGKGQKPLARCDGSWDLRDKPTCITPSPSNIMPMALIKAKMKSDSSIKTSMK